MSFDPYVEIAKDMHKKMEKILSPPPAICIATENAEVLYMDEGLLERLEYIQEYIKTNFDLIEDGQYSFPISGTLLGFFKMSSNLMFILFAAVGESSKIGKLLLFRGLLENYHRIIEELKSDLETVQELENSANLVLTLRSKPDFSAPAFVEKIAPAEEKITASGRIEIGGTLPTQIDAETPIPEITPSIAQIYPELLEKYRNKKFNFMEGIILQYCDGQLTLDEVVAKSKYSKEEVMVVLESFEKKGWLLLHRKAGGKTLDKLIDVISTPQEDLSSEAVEAKAETVTPQKEAPAKEPGAIYPELLDKYRNKKFNFKEGIILQYCTGEHTLKEIIEKSKFSEDEVKEVITQYQKKEWLILRT